MANKTIYMKDEKLWQRAKALSGEAGLSSVIADALADFVQRKEAAERGLVRVKADIRDVASPDATGSPKFTDKERIAFDGRLVAKTDIRSELSGREGDAVIYLTEGRKLVVILQDRVFDLAWDYRVFDSSRQVQKFFEAADLDVDADARREISAAVAKALGEDWTMWID